MPSDQNDTAGLSAFEQAFATAISDADAGSAKADELDTSGVVEKVAPSGEPKAETAPEPKAETAPEPKAETAPEPAPDQTPEPAPDPTPEPAPDSTPESKIEAAPEPKASDLAREIADALRQSTQPPKAAEPVSEPIPRFQFSDQQVKDIAEFEESFPEVARAVSARMAQQAHELATYMFTQVAQRYEPLIGQISELMAHQQRTDLRASVPDYDKLDKQAVLDWIDKQPSYLRDAYTEVANSGTAQDVADMLARFRAETGKVDASPTPKPASAPAAAPKPAPAPAAAPKPAPSAAAETAAKRLSPVKTQRAQPDTTGAVDKNDYEGAFRLFAQSE